MSLPETKDQNKKHSNILYYILIVLGSLLLYGATAYYYSRNIGIVFECCMFSLVGAGCIVFCITQDLFKQTLHFDNGNHIGRFVFFYFCSVLLSCLFPMLPYYGWIFPVIALILSLFSNSIVGIISSGCMLSFTFIFSKVPSYTFFLYFVICVFAVILFEQIDENYETGLRLFIILIVYASFLFGTTVFTSKTMPDFEVFLAPMISLFANYILFTCVLHLYSVMVVHKQKNIYLIINDQEYDLIKEFKEKDSMVYYHAIHASYFCEKIARALHMNVDLAKAGGYYNKIIPIIAKENDKTVQEICDEHSFPNDVQQLLQEYLDKQTPIRMKETALVYLADTVVSSIMYLFQKDKDAELDYPKIVKAIFVRKKDSGILNNCDLSIRELLLMEQIFAGEKLYYDFLR